MINCRRVLVQQWEGSVRVLNQRHDDINRIADEIRNLKLVARDRLKDLEEQKTFFENEKKNNKELEKEIENLNKQVADNKEKIMMAEQIIVEEADKVDQTTDILKFLIGYRTFIKFSDFSWRHFRQYLPRQQLNSIKSGINTKL